MTLNSPAHDWSYADLEEETWVGIGSRERLIADTLHGLVPLHVALRCISIVAEAYSDGFERGEYAASGDL